MKASQLIEWCRHKVGSGYVYGTVGQLYTAAVEKSVKSMYGAIMPKGYYENRCAKWRNKWVADCSGLFKAARKSLDGVWADVSAQGTYDQCPYAQRGEIATMPLQPGTYVFMYGKAAEGTIRMVHVGMYIGDGGVIEARGADYGIVITKLKNRGWTHWGKPVYVDYDIPAETGAAAVGSEVDSGDASTPKGDDPKVSTWAKASWEKACAKGILDGTNPQGTVTREMLTVVLERLKMV